MPKIIYVYQEEIECDCGNTSFQSGFFACLEDGSLVEPTIDSGWDGLYVCMECDQIFKYAD
ncbi:hypothetical protein [Salibacterium aidingense]|uniref:hypothetical protein n=1 Tax=Salibacterium aidingense TaxID=384933 RepID=UPI000429EE04|nr:hypothetical protein [Salibacterium aidingense]